MTVTLGMRRTDITREEWLEKATDLLEPLFKRAGVKALPVRVSVGFPIIGARPSSKMRIGECWGSNATADKKPAIFIHPMCADAFDVLSTLAHELIHAYVGVKEGHKGEFKRVALAIGFLPPMRSTPCGDDLKEELEKVAKKLGPYPHAKLIPSARKKAGTRLLKAECPECGYIVRVTRTWLENAGGPICPLDKVAFTFELPADDEGEDSADDDGRTVAVAN